MTKLLNDNTGFGVVGIVQIFIFHTAIWNYKLNLTQYDFFACVYPIVEVYCYAEHGIDLGRRVLPPGGEGLKIYISNNNV